MREELILFILTFAFVFILYQLFVVRSAKKNRDNRSKKKPIEVRYIMNRFKLTMKDVDYDQLLQLIAIASSLDIAIVVSVMFSINNFLLELLVGLVLMVVLEAISFNLIGKYYYRKKVNKK